jgi:predicted RNA-binding protein with PIN domain
MSHAAGLNWLIDGMNVIGSRPDGWWRDREGAIAKLSARLAVFAASTPVEVRVVFDGPLPESQQVTPDVGVTFAPGGRNAADRRIVAFLRSSPDAGAWQVVTSDRELADACSSLGVAVMGAGEFRKMLENAVPVTD